MHNFLFRDDEGIVPYWFLIGSRNDRGIVTEGNPWKGPNKRVC